MNKYVIGFIGSDRVKKAKELSDEYIVLSDYIEKMDGRSVKRICMMMGEHELRNKEYEALSKIRNENPKATVVCTDGILLDEMCKAIVESGDVYFVNDSAEACFKNALEGMDNNYAFLLDDNIERKKEKFIELYNSRLNQYLETERKSQR